MLKRLALIVGSIAGLTYLRKKARQQQAEQDLWAQATDDVSPSTMSPPVAPAPAASQDGKPADQA
jgi:hypothetical protein